jgi:low temperature requirement protein LtrA
VWLAASGTLWIAGGCAHGTARDLLWLAAVGVDNLGPLIGFPTPGLGRSGTADRAITGSHMAERCHLFVIIALGESIIVTGSAFAARPAGAAALPALCIAFLGSVALWWIYFDRAADSGARAIAASDDPARLGRAAYTYLHIPMIAGVIVTAVADELTIAGPGRAMTAPTATAVLLGPALFLAGHVFFHRIVSGKWAVSRIAGLAAAAGPARRRRPAGRAVAAGHTGRRRRRRGRHPPHPGEAAYLQLCTATASKVTDR